MLALGVQSAAGAAAQQAEAVVSVVASEATLAPGETATVVVQVSGVANLYGVDVALAFDPTLIEIVDADSVSAGVQVVAWPSLTQQQRNSIWTIFRDASNQDGTARVAMTLMAPAQPISGSTQILAMTVRALAEGTVEITVTSSDLSTEDGEAIAHSIVGESIEITTPAPAPDTTGNDVLLPLVIMWQATRLN
ncbi:MAG: cohesin domain-containing protein [Anaerolineae bacterium]